MTKKKAALIYSMFVSLDGYAEDVEGKFGWGFAEDEAVHSYINRVTKNISTFLYGRKMYDVMVFWETAHQDPQQQEVILEFAKGWQAAYKIVFSKTMKEVRSARTKIEKEFDPAKIHDLKKSLDHDISVDGTELAAQAFKAGLVDRIQLIQCPVIVGGGKRFFPEDIKLKLELINEKKFANGVLFLDYEVIAHEIPINSVS